MLGTFENFPENFHGILRFHHRGPLKKLQVNLLQALHSLSREEGLDLSSIHAVSDCRVNFDFGIAEGATFNYLSRDMLSALIEAISKRALPVLDFLCVARYYRKDGRGSYRPLKFDYYLLRFLFYDKNVDFQIFHERGTRRLSIEDLSKVIISRVDQELSEDGVESTTVEDVRML